MTMSSPVTDSVAGADRSSRVCQRGVPSSESSAHSPCSPSSTYTVRPSDDNAGADETPPGTGCDRHRSVTVPSASAPGVLRLMSDRLPVPGA